MWMCFALALALSVWLPTAAADQAPDDPCDRRCGRKLSCAVLNESFTCNAITRQLGCDCTGCCLASSSPLGPEAPTNPAAPLPSVVTPRVARTADLGNFVLEKVVRLSKTYTANVAQTLKLTIGMGGTDVSPAHWTIESSSVPTWLSLSVLSGSIDAMESLGELSLTVNTTGLFDSTSPYTAELKLKVASQLNQSFLVPVEFYVSAATIASTSIWGRPNSETRACRARASSLDPIEVILGDVVEVPFSACDFEGLAVEHVHSGSFEAVLIDRSSGGIHPLPIAYGRPPPPPVLPPSVPLDCPCLQSYPDGVQLNRSSLNVVVRGEALQYPSDYGLQTCKAHDMHLPPFCATAAPGGDFDLLINEDFCPDSWCYIDVDQCNVQYFPSFYVQGSTLYYSYATCGSEDSFTTEYQQFWQSRRPPVAYVAAVRTNHLSGRRLGEFGLQLSFIAGDFTRRQVDVERAVLAVCPPGQVEHSDGSSCSCAGGEYLDVRTCKWCPQGQFCPLGATMPIRCPIGFTTVSRGSKSSDDCGCPRGTFENVAAGTGISCKPCEDGMNCTQIGLTLATVPLLPSWWRLSNLTASTYKCDSSACRGGDWNGTADGYCAPGHEGPRCEWCSDPSRYYDDATATCAECGQLIAYAIQRICVLLLIVILLALLSLAMLHPPSQLACVSQTLTKIMIRAGRFGVKSKFKLWLTFFQVWAVKQSVYGFSPQPELSDWLSFLNVFTFDLGGFIFPSWSCVGGVTTRLAFSGLWPLLLMFAVAVAHLAHEALRKGSLERALMRSLEAAIFISFCLLPSVTDSLFLAFQCEDLRYNDTVSPPESRAFLSASLKAECRSEEHVPIYTTAWVLIVLWPVATPLLYALLLFHCRHAIANHQPTSISRAIHFLWNTYEDEFFWWELVELGKRTLLTNFLGFIDQNDGGSNKMLRPFCGLVISVVTLVIQLIAQPFRSKVDDYLSSLVQLALVLFFAFGMLLKLCESEGTNTIHSLMDAGIKPSQTCSEIVGIESARSASVLLISVAIFVLLAPLAMFSHKAAIEAKKEQAACKAAAALGRMSNPPTCSWQLKAGNRYATFLSHCKLEAGADARYLSDLIQRMTSCPAYLDVTDLLDLRKLFSEGVHRSEFVVVLATKSFFTRPWCLIEIWEAAVKRVPVMLFPVVGKHWTLEDTVELLGNLRMHMRARNKECIRHVLQHVEVQGVVDIREVEDLLLAHLGLVPSLERGGRPASIDLDERLCTRLRIDVSELGEWLLAQHARVERQLKILSWDSCGTDNQIISSVQTLINEGAASLGRETPEWIVSQAAAMRSPRSWTSFRITSIGKWASGLNLETRTSTSSKMSLLRQGALKLKRTSSRRGASSATTLPKDNGTLLIVCAREENDGHLSLLKQKLGKGLQCEVIIGTAHTETWRNEAQRSTRGVVLLQTKSVLRDPVRLLQLFEAALQRHPLVCINVIGGGYEFTAVKPLLSSLQTELSPAQMTTLRTELQEVSDHSVEQLSSSLIDAVPNAISASLDSAAGDVRVNAQIDDILYKLRRRKYSKFSGDVFIPGWHAAASTG